MLVRLGMTAPDGVFSLVSKLKQLSITENADADMSDMMIVVRSTDTAYTANVTRTKA